jgi:hypothetical protein
MPKRGYVHPGETIQPAHEMIGKRTLRRLTGVRDARTRYL